MSTEGEVRARRTPGNSHVLEIEVDRAEKMNGFTPEMFEALSDRLTELDEDSDLWVGLLTFAGENTTAGLDLPRFAGAMMSGERDADAAADNRVDPFALRRRCSKPVVMAVQGVTFTIGIEMMLAADIVIAADDCRFCQMEPRRGLAVFGGAHVRYVERAGWGNAMYHLLRADEFDAARAREIGFVQEVVPTGTQLERAREIAAEICANAPLAVQEIRRGAAVYLERGESAAFAEISEMRRRTAGSKDFAEGMASFREKRAARFTGE
jgi:enoyl-CoA hydratase